MEKNQNENTKENCIGDEDVNHRYANDHFSIDTIDECMMETTFKEESSNLNINAKTIHPIKIDPNFAFASTNEHIWQSLAPTIKDHFATLKRLINRSIRNRSHCGAYNLPFCSHDNNKSISLGPTSDASAFVSTSAAIFGTVNKCEYLPKVSRYCLLIIDAINLEKMFLFFAY